MTWMKFSQMAFQSKPGGMAMVNFSPSLNQDLPHDRIFGSFNLQVFKLFAKQCRSFMTAARRTGRDKLRVRVALLFGGIYLLNTTGWCFQFISWLHPLSATVLTWDLICSRHACGCKTEEDCQMNCCCSGKNRNPIVSLHRQLTAKEREPTSQRIRLVGDRHCSGHFPHQGPVAGQKTSPHLGLEEIFWSPSAAAASFHGLNDPSPTSFPKRPPGKIPIRSFPC